MSSKTGRAELSSEMGRAENVPDEVGGLEVPEKVFNGNMEDNEVTKESLEDKSWKKSNRSDRGGSILKRMEPVHTIEDLVKKIKCRDVLSD